MRLVELGYKCLDSRRKARPTAREMSRILRQQLKNLKKSDANCEIQNNITLKTLVIEKEEISDEDDVKEKILKLQIKNKYLRKKQKEQKSVMNYAKSGQYIKHHYKLLQRENEFFKQIYKHYEKIIKNNKSHFKFDPFSQVIFNKT